MISPTTTTTMTVMVAGSVRSIVMVIHAVVVAVENENDRNDSSVDHETLDSEYCNVEVPMSISSLFSLSQIISLRQCRVLFHNNNNNDDTDDDNTNGDQDVSSLLLFRFLLLCLNCLCLPVHGLCGGMYDSLLYKRCVLDV
jgi:hypothetical protein